MMQASIQPSEEYRFSSYYHLSIASILLAIKGILAKPQHLQFDVQFQYICYQENALEFKGVKNLSFESVCSSQILMPQFELLFIITLIIIKMGCQCFRPPKSHQQVYTKIVQQIYDTACLINSTEQTKVQKQQNQIYELVLEKLTKKGDIRKLIDNLSSRKQKIISCASLNFKYLNEVKKLQQYCAGLIIIDSIVEIIYFKKQQTLSESEGQVSEQSISSMKDSFSKFTENTIKKFTSKKDLSHQMNYNDLDLHYFKTIQLIFQQKQLKRNILQSIIKFSSNHQGSIRCQAQVWKFIHKIYINISQNVQKNLGFQAIKYLIFKTKDQICQQMKNRDFILFIIFIWIEEEQKTQKTLLQENISQILNIYFNRFASSWESQYIYETILCAFDQIECDINKQILLLKLCDRFSNRSQICHNFRRSLFNHTLGYLSKIEGKNQSKGWLISLGVKLDTMNILLKNATKKDVKLFTFKRVNRWISEQYVDIDEFCLYNSKGLVQVFTSNLVFYYKDKLVFDNILKQYIELYNKTGKQTKIRLVQTAAQQFRGQWQPTKNKVLIAIINQMISESSKHKQQSKLNINAYCLPIEIDMQQQNKKLALKLNSIVIPTQSYSSFDQLARRKFANLLYSLYYNIAYSTCLFSDRYQFTKQSFDYLQALEPNISKYIYIAYLTNLNQSIRQNNFNLMSIQVQFCILYLSLAVSKLAYNKQIPPRFATLKQNLDRQQDNINNCIPKLIADFDTKYYLQHYFQVNQTQAANDKIDTLYLDYNSIFFRLFNSQQFDKTEIAEQKTIGLQNRNSNAMSESQNIKSLDKSFEDALDALAQR